MHYCLSIEAPREATGGGGSHEACTAQRRRRRTRKERADQQCVLPISGRRRKEREGVQAPPALAFSHIFAAIQPAPPPSGPPLYTH